MLCKASKFMLKIIIFLDSGPYDRHTSLCQIAACMVGCCANQGTLFYIKLLWKVEMCQTGQYFMGCYRVPLSNDKMFKNNISTISWMHVYMYWTNKQTNKHKYSCLEPTHQNVLYVPCWLSFTKFCSVWLQDS